MIMFKIGETDYSNRVIASNYNINSTEVYTTWTDASKTEHRSLERKRVVGSFDVYFKTIEEYEAFTEQVAAVKDDNLAVDITVCDNKTNTEMEINAFIDYTPIRSKDGLNNDTMGTINITIQER